MSEAPRLRETPELPEEILQSALEGDLVLFVGAGISRLVELPSWKGLAQLALKDLRKKGYLDYSEMDQLKTLDPRKLLSIVQSIAEDNKCPLDLKQHLGVKESDKGIYKYLNKIGCACVTTNYDELLSPHFYKTQGGSTTASPINRVIVREEFFAGHLDTPGTVVHLHGSCSKPERMVITTKDYLEHYDDKMVQHFLGQLFEKKTVLFVGYSLEEAEILEHILRRGNVKAKDSNVRRRFATHPFFSGQTPLYQRLYDYYRKSFGVYLIGFLRDYENYGQLETIFKIWSEQIEVRPPALVKDLDYMDEVLG
jgi:hypothetical protein